MTDNEILQMREKGYTYQQIADIEGVSRQAIHQRTKTMKIRKVKSCYDQDITFCINKKCTNKKCGRNPCHTSKGVTTMQNKELSFTDIVKMLQEACDDNFYSGDKDIKETVIKCATQIYIAQIERGDNNA